MVLPLADRTYLEIVEVLDHPASDKAPFGQAVRARSALGGGSAGGLLGQWIGVLFANGVQEVVGSPDLLGYQGVSGDRSSLFYLSGRQHTSERF